ncbi:MAG: cache domain-containing protein, partial [Chloroflexota bacterium]
MFRKLSIFWILLVAILITSGVPLGLLAYNAIRTTESGVEREQINQLGERVHAHANTINGQFHEFQTATGLAAADAKSLMLTASRQIPAEEIENRLGKYARDSNNVFGLDAWYNAVYLPQAGDNRQSNVFLNKDTALTPKLNYDIAITEDLNPLFEQIKDSGIGTQWIYLTTAEGMLRLYPWAGNEGYPVDWQPQTISFYTVAAPERNPERKSVWTAPYNDFAGAGVMVTNSLPIYDGDRLVAVMSHDFLIKDLQQQVLGFKVGEQGFAFLLDEQGNIVAHKD